MLSVQVQGKRFRDRRVIMSGVHFSLTGGERVALVGPSGSGKTTLLNLIAGLDTDYRGRIDLEVADQAGNIAMMFQDARLMPWLSVLENLMLVARDTTRSPDAALQILSRVEMSEFADHYPAQLSGGMQKRVALARALVNRPRLLLMDEPFASLHTPAAVELREMVKRYCRQTECTLLYVTHDLHEAVDIADRILFFSASPMRLVLDQPLGELKFASTDSVPVAEICRGLMKQHPRLLEGVI